MSADLLSDVLRAVRLRGALFFDVQGRTPWTAEAPPAIEIIPTVMPGAEHLIEFHGVVDGACWAAIVGDDAPPPVRLAAQDVVLFPQGDPHVLSSEPGDAAAVARGARPVLLQPAAAAAAVPHLGRGVDAGRRPRRAAPGRAARQRRVRVPGAGRAAVQPVAGGAAAGAARVRGHAGAGLVGDRVPAHGGGGIGGAPAGLRGGPGADERDAVRGGAAAVRRVAAGGRDRLAGRRARSGGGAGPGAAS